MNEVKKTGVASSRSPENAVVGACVLWLSARCDGRRRAAGVMVLLQLGTRWRRREWLQKRCGLDERRCLRAIRDLLDVGVIVKQKVSRSENEGRAGVQFVYAIADCVGPAPAGAGKEREQSLRVASVPRGTQQLQSFVRLGSRIATNSRRRPRPSAKRVR